MADSKRGGRSNDDEFDDELAAGDELDGDDTDLADDGDDSDGDGSDDGDGDDAASGKEGERKAKGERVATAAKARTGRSSGKRDDAGISIFGRFTRFVREVVAEMQKVIYPTRKELVTYTTVVVVFVTVVMTVVGLLDVGFAKLMLFVFGDQTSS